MSRLIRLYPAPWRARYGAELIELLDRRPLTLNDRIDLARGALDAHLHPQLDRLPQPWTHRIPGLLALTAGLLWAWSFAFLAFWADPDADWGSGFGIAFLLMLMSVPGDYLLFGYGRRVATVIGFVIGGMILGRLLPWSPSGGLFNGLAGASAYLLILGGLLMLAAIRTGIGTTGRWLLLLGVVIAPVAVSVPVILGLAASGVSGTGFVLVFAFFVPYGIAWAFVGLRMTLRGSQTLDDPPNQSEALANAA